VPGVRAELVLEHGDLRVLALDLSAEVQQLDARSDAIFDWSSAADARILARLLWRSFP
jgi:hypothetical protein